MRHSHPDSEVESYLRKGETGDADRFLLLKLPAWEAGKIVFDRGSAFESHHKLNKEEEKGEEKSPQNSENS